MVARFCKYCHKFMGFDHVSRYCDETCEKAEIKRRWNLKNNNGIPSNDIKYITRTMLSNYRTWANERKLDFNITLEDIQTKFIEQDKCCALTGDEMFFVPEKTASLDRIDSKIGYQIDNIQWVLKDVNKMKNNLPEDRFIDICIKVSNYKGENHG